jgi:dipeptidyl aminopeptidase/acylaminoacyl peptidase
MRKLLVIVIAGVASLSSFADPPATEAAYPGANGRIVYATNYGVQSSGRLWIGSMAANGSDRTPLTTSHDSPHGDGRPAWSPGGTLIVFTRYDSDGEGDLWIMNANGTGEKRVTSHHLDEDWGSFSADGSRIAYASNRSGSYEIYTMRIDGTDVQQLTNDTYDDTDPAWSPRNDRIAFVSNRSGADAIHSMKPDGSSRYRYTTPSGSRDGEPDWSPDGGHIVFSRVDPSGNSDLRRVNALSSVVVPVLTTPVPEGQAAYAPDGPASPHGAVVYTQMEGDSVDLRVVSTTSPGAGIDLTTDSADIFAMPNWQPIPAFPLVDAKFSPYKSDIQWAFGEGITTGCTAEVFCIDAIVTREQMASFLVRALDLPVTPNDYFTDDEGSVHEVDINRVAAAAIATGCEANLYCPKAEINRGQMASFLARAFDLPATGNDYFTDDESSVHEDDINRVAAAGWAFGCGASWYCPNQLISRGQMTAFLHRAVD